MSDKEHQNLLNYALVIFAAIAVVAFLYLNDQLRTQALFSSQPNPKIEEVNFALD